MTEFEELYPYIYQCKNILDPWTFVDLHDYFFDAVDMGGLSFKKESDAPKYANRWLALQKPLVDDQSLGDDFYLINLGTKLKYEVQRVLGYNVTLTRVNTNIQFPYQDSTFHSDGGTDTWTLLVFFTKNWNTSWGGEFIICKGDDDYMGIPYIPNRAVLFNGAIDHRGSAPNSLAEYPRLSIAFSYKEV